jgi:hypothetical protein
VSQVANSPAQAGRGPEVPPVRARSGRRPLPPLVFLAVLAVAAAAVWVYVLRSDGGQGTSNVACTTAPTDLAPSSVTVHVLNATSKQGQATTVAKDLQSRGFQVGAPDNDRSGRTVSGVGEIRHGARGKEAAALLAAYLPGATDYQDTRATGTVDLVIGPAYEKLATPDQVTAALRAPSC